MTIPASAIVKINPGVITAGGAGLVLNGLFLTQSLLMPTGSVLSFAPGPSSNLAQYVAAFFGLASPEAAAASIYFLGYANSTLNPSAMLFAAYNASARSAFLNSGSFAGVQLSALQALGGASATGSIGATFTATGTGTSLVVTAVTGLISPGDTIAGTGVPAGTTILNQVSGTVGGAGTYTTSAATTAAAGTVTSFGTVLNVTTVASGVLNGNSNVTGTGITAGTQITGQLSGTTGGIGTYSINQIPAAYVASTALTAGLIINITIDGVAKSTTLLNLSTVSSFSAAAALIAAAFTSGPTVAFSSTTSKFVFTSTTTGIASTIAFGMGGGSTALQLTQATGAVLSQGAAADTPTSAMANAVAGSQNWVSMVTLFEPTLSNKELFAQWFNASDDQFLYLAWDSDTQASVAGASEPFGVVALTAAYNGVACIGGDPNILNFITPGGTTPLIPTGTTLAQLVENVAIFVAGAIGSINYAQTNGRVTLAFLAQSGLLPTCANGQTYANLLANGYSAYGAFATRNQSFTFFSNSNMPGEFDWIDTYVNNVWMVDQFSVTYMTLLTILGSIAFNAGGYAQLRNGLIGGPIAAALNFGAIRTGVVLSSTQIEDVNTKAGLAVDQIISSQGYYLQILDPGATVRQDRGSPIINFWYTDGGSVQLITMSADDIL